MIHCLSNHEPVVTDLICIYCGLVMVLEFENDFERTNHDPTTCDQCVLLEG